MSLKVKLALILFGLFSAAVAGEIGLFCFSSGFTHFSEAQTIPLGKEHGLKVLCLGDSFTYGIGAARGQSFPAQLENILAKQLGTEVVVINGGMPSANSAIVLAKLNSFLSHTNFDIVVVTVGRNDCWNYKQLDQTPDWKVELKAFFSQSRVYKLLNISMIDLKTVWSKTNLINKKYKKKDELSGSPDLQEMLLKANQLRAAKSFKPALVLYEQILNKYPKSIVAMLEASRCYKLDNQDDKAIAMLTQALLKEEDSEEVLKEITSLFIEKGTLEQRRDFFDRMAMLLPENKEMKSQLFWANIKLADQYYQRGDRDKAVVFYNKAICLDPDNEQIYSNLYFNKAMEFNPGKGIEIINDPKRKGQIIWETTFGAVSRIAKICQEKRMRLILSGYPEEIYDAVNTVAKDYKVVFVDQRDAFADKKSGEIRFKYFTPDGHCTKYGYRIMAENIARQIIGAAKK